ncbi:hypothetical protein RYZ27_08020 [Hyphomonas sp. FCG-A18]|uniref:hypothetical protein n=1 Tax=Hyphomonas sp. FCG-A18 TaxID=3080019 RepID=UPI002B2E0551|nr:hypothetical protein RYZ27_08020 [Hyphomonas sp. FCG-A18]
MDRMKTTLGALTATILLLAGCSQTALQDQQAVTETAKEEPAKLGPPIKTVKPGAGIALDYELAGPVAAGENGSVTLTLTELYLEGSLIVEARGDDGLEVFGSEASSRFDLASADTHTMRVEYRAETDGVYYIGLMATVTTADGQQETRAHSVRVDIGDWQAAEAKAEKPQVEVSESGEAMVILEAEETTE